MLPFPLPPIYGDPFAEFTCLWSAEEGMLPSGLYVHTSSILEERVTLEMVPNHQKN